MFFEQRFEQGFRSSERGFFQGLNGRPEINQAMIGSHVQQANVPVTRRPIFFAMRNPMRSSTSSRSARRFSASAIASVWPASRPKTFGRLGRHGLLAMSAATQSSCEPPEAFEGRTIRFSSQ